MSSSTLRDRYLRDPLAIRLGGLAADLARVASFAENPENAEVVASLLEEGKYFAEWAAPEAPLEVQEQLARVQLQLALWQRRWTTGRADPGMKGEAKRWSDVLLRLSGLAV